MDQKIQNIYTLFKELNINYKVEEHVEVPTTELLVSTLGHLPGKLVKNLFVKDKKHGYFLICLSADTNLDTKSIGKLLNLGKMNLRFADEASLDTLLNVKQGSVTPLAIVYDTENQVRLVLDKKLVDADIVNCHPMSCDRTVSISSKDLMNFIANAKHEAIVIDCEAELSTDSKAPVKGAAKGKKDNGGKKSKRVEKDTKNKSGLSYSKKTDFTDWYTDTITKAGLIDYYDISGCYILRPWAYSIWESIQAKLDGMFKSVGVKNCYFPMFVSSEKLTKEEEHLEGFAPEVAWITKYGNSDLKEHIAIRPTSETIMYPAFKNWIRSHRDLPLKLNQWNNVVRWEFKKPTPFIRTREFLWQEGHTAHETKEEADAQVMESLDFYIQTYEQLLAVPMIPGRKSEKEKFAGADYTTTIEGFIPDTGRGIQAATSHQLGQNFGKMFNIVAEGDKGEKIIPYQTSWGFTTRSIGVMIMVHGDDKGLVLPPRVAPTQIAIVPIPFKENEDAIYDKAGEIQKLLSNIGVRVQVDNRRNYTPGWKYNDWELKGVPLRFEFGPRDMEKGQVRIVRRDNGEKQDVAIQDLPSMIPKFLETIQAEMLAKATATRDSCIVKVNEWKDFVPALQQNCMCLTPFCNELEWEEKVKDKSRTEALALSGEEEEEDNTATSAAAKSLCIPFKYNEQPPPEGTKCFVSGKPATCYMLWGRSY